MRSLIKEITPKFCRLYFVLINSVPLNFLGVWIIAYYNTRNLGHRRSGVDVDVGLERSLQPADLGKGVVADQLLPVIHVAIHIIYCHRNRFL